MSASPGYYMNPYTWKNNTAFVTISVCPFLKDVNIYTMVKVKGKVVPVLN
jgi:hypothetical protein